MTVALRVKVSRDYGQLFDHLRKHDGVEFRDKDHYVEVIYKGATVGRLGKSGSVSPQVISEFKHSAPSLIDGYSGPGVKSPVRINGHEDKTKVVDVSGKRAASLAGDRERATAIRLRTVLDQFESKPLFVEWAREVGKERHMRVFTPSSGLTTVYALLNETRAIGDWTLDLIDAAIDEVYSTGKSTPEEIHRQIVEPPPAPAKPTQPAKPIAEKEKEVATRPTVTAPAFDVELEKKRYMDKLWALAESGDKDALDRIEALLFGKK